MIDVDKLRPAGDHLLVRLKQDEVRDSGLIVPRTNYRYTQEVTVLAVGPGRVTRKGVRAPLEVRVGDRCLVRRYPGEEIPHTECEYVVLREKDILGVLEADDGDGG